MIEPIPILTTLYVDPDPARWRYRDLDEWIKHCLKVAGRKRLVCVEFVPDAFRDWLLKEGHEIIVEGKDCGPSRPRMAAMLGKALESLSKSEKPPDCVWVIENDACVSAETLAAVEGLFKALPKEAAAVELRAIDETGKTEFPCVRRFPSRPWEKRPMNPFPISHACWSASLWRMAALRQVDFSQLPPLNQSDIQASAQLKAKGWCFYGIASATYVHRSHGSYARGEDYHRDPTIEKPLRLNLGCGAFYKPGYVNVDVREELDQLERREIKADLLADATCGLDQFIGRCDEIYAGHVLEHLENPLAALRYWLRLLKPGVGRILVVIPDSAKAIADNNLEQLKAHIGLYLLDSSKQPTPADHLQIYWLGRLRSEMERAGFADLREVDIQKEDRLASKAKCQSALEARRPSAPEVKKTAFVLDWPDKSKGSIENLKRSLTQAGWRVRSFIRDGAWWNEAVKTLREKRPDYFIAFQRLYGFDKAVADQLRSSRIKTLFFDFGIGCGRSHYGTVIADPLGEGAASEISIRGMDAILRDRHWRNLAESQLDNVDRLSADLHEKASSIALEGMPKDYWLLLLQRSGEMHLCCDSQFRQSDKLAEALMTLAADSAINQFIAIKPHPMDAKWEWSGEQRSMNHWILPAGGFDAESDAHLLRLIADARAVISVNSTTIFLAMLLGKPVLQLGRGWASGNKVVTEAKLDRSLFGKPPNFDSERRRWFLALMLARQIGENDLANVEKAMGFIHRFYPEGNAI